MNRYGFVDEPLRDRSESRLALIPFAPLSKIPKLPRPSPLAGKARPQPTSSFGPGPATEPPAPQIPDPRHERAEASSRTIKENERVSKWMGMMSVRRKDAGGNAVEWGWKAGAVDKKTVKRVYKGVPDRWRMAAWWTMVQQKAGESSGSSKGKKKADDLAREYQVRMLSLS